ncbi:MAG TPA: AGE family epimerase/isomerase [Chitinophagaceae bacterium]|nr:AGE family epimerase/isomerase [Chitinophagaceae bacterium]
MKQHKLSFGNALTLSLVILALSIQSCRNPETDERLKMADVIENSIQTEMLNVWYPRAIDTVYGGFLSSFTYNWQPTGNQDKMIVTQARHTWSNSKAAMLYPENPVFRKAAQHGYAFLRDVMWDDKAGGFYNLVDRTGKPIQEMKTAYGNSFAIYGLSAYIMATGDTGALALVKKAFAWLEANSHDPVHKGYFQHLGPDGRPIARPDSIASTSDLGYKDQNSSIHLLEAFTELYQVWPDPLVKERLTEMLLLIRDTIVDEHGSLVLFFQPNWAPISFRDSSYETIMKHHQLDHVSFGHDVETAYLMIEASYILGLKNDTKTQAIAKKMIDHSLAKGWDHAVGGFYDEGYYFKDSTDITITRDTKNWWAQAEGLNTLLLMADLYPQDPQNYYDKFNLMWQYIDKYLIDHEHGDWYSGGLDKQPELKTALKGHIWKGNYHQFRSLSNCVKALRRSGGTH